MKPRNYIHATIAAAFLALPASAQEIAVTVDGQPIDFVGQKPVQRDGNTLVPLRGVFERLGADVTWQAATRTIVATKGATTVSLQLGNTTAFINGRPQALTVPPQTMSGSTMVPLRFVSEALGADVRWISSTSTVVIATGGAAGGAPGATTPTTPGANPSAGAPLVSSLMHDAGGRTLRAGDRVTVTLSGTPGALAAFTVPGVAALHDIAMREMSPGSYQGTFRVPENLNLKGASVLASLRNATGSSPVLQAAQTLSMDGAAPLLAGLAPAENASVGELRPLIYGTFNDTGGSGLDTASSRLLVNGQDVTAQATFTDAFFSYKPTADLAPGRTTATLIARDMAGNETRKVWHFTVEPAENPIRSITVSPQNRTLEPGDVVTVRLEAKPGGRAHFEIGSGVDNVRMREESPGVYVGAYTVRKGDALSQTPVTVTFAMNGKTVTQSDARGVTVAAGKPVTPIIESPQEGAAAGGRSIVIVGKAAPGATVRVSLAYRGRLLIVTTQGQLQEVEVKADAKGVWRTEALPLESPLGVKDIVYTVQAVTVGAAETSEPATVSFRR